MNVYQRNSTFVLRWIGFLFVGYAVTGAASFLYHELSGTEVPPMSAHIFGVAEYLAVGIVLIAFSIRIGKWLGGGLE
jgi:hypothetical protein